MKAITIVEIMMDEHGKGKLTDGKHGFCYLVIVKRDRQTSKTTDMASCALTCKDLTADCVDNADISLY